MKRILFLLFLISLGIVAVSQTCEEKELKLNHTLNGFSAGLLYNTYGLIGSISDAYANDIYNNKTVNDLLGAQKKMISNLGSMMDSLVQQNILHRPTDISYAQSVKNILDELSKQADLMLAYVKNKTPQKLEAYEEQRNKNWSAINKLMGIKD